MKKNKKKVIITGAQGQDGLILSKLFIRNKFKVIGIIKTSKKKVIKGVKYHKISLNNFSVLSKTLKKINPNIITILDEFQYDFSPDYWSPPTIYTFGDDNDIMLIPKDAGPHIIEQVYDYPHIKKLDIQATERTLMDVIFISYDEPNAEKHWKMLKEKCPRAKRVQNIKGQTEAYHTAAKLSKTEWFYAVFAKHEPVESFNYDWQPNRLKAPCHYIFYGINEINKLEYGHSGVILYEKNYYS